MDLTVENFGKTGLIYLKDFLDKEKVALAQEAFFEICKERNLRDEKSWTIDHMPKTEVPIGVSKLIGRINHLNELGNLISSDVRSIISSFIDPVNIVKGANG